MKKRKEWWKETKERIFKNERRNSTQKAHKGEIPSNLGAENDHNLLYYQIPPIIQKDIDACMEECERIAKTGGKIGEEHKPDPQKEEPDPAENEIRELCQSMVFMLYSYFAGFLGVVLNLSFKADYEKKRFDTDGIVT